MPACRVAGDSKAARKGEAVGALSVLVALQWVGDALPRWAVAGTKLPWALHCVGLHGIGLGWIKLD